jgi:hypothetical protein
MVLLRWSAQNRAASRSGQHDEKFNNAPSPGQKRNRKCVPHWRLFIVSLFSSLFGLVSQTTRKLSASDNSCKVGGGFREGYDATRILQAICLVEPPQCREVFNAKLRHRALANVAPVACKKRYQTRISIVHANAIRRQLRQDQTGHLRCASPHRSIDELYRMAENAQRRTPALLRFQ